MNRSAGMFFGLLCALVLAASASGGPDKTTEKTNPLIEEMLSLDRVFREVVSGVSLGDGSRVHDALHAMHGTMEKTHEGVSSGSVKIPKNADRIEDFVRLDKDFHADLERLAVAAHGNDWEKMLSLTKTLMDGCVNCHCQFRK